MEEKTNLKKIIINANHELTDIAREIHDTDAQRIILTFTDQSDLLISPINLKVLLEISEKEDKLLIAQIIQNPTGVRNSKLAGIKVIETPSAPTEDDWIEVMEEKENRNKPEIIEEPKKESIVTEESEIKRSSSFEDRVNNAISRSKEPRKIETLEEEDSFISIDEDTNTQENISLAGKDFASMPREEGITEKVKIENPLKNFKPIFKGINFKNKKVVRIILIALGILLLVPGIGFAIYNQMVPIAKVKIFVEAKNVEIEKVFVGDPNIKEVDFDNLKIPVKTEEIKKSLSDTITPTGKAFKGEKAKGSVTITYWKSGGCVETTPVVSITNGHTITTGNLTYKTTSAVELTCNQMATVELVAADIGEDFNIGASKPFTVQGYSSAEVYGLNAAPFTGGTKEEYTVLSQKDVDTVVESLTATAIEEVKSELRENESAWEIIENSIKSEVEKDSVKTDKKVGEEASVVNLEVTIKGTATYYSTKGLNDSLTDILRQEAEAKNLFESENELELSLGDTIEKKLVVNDEVKDKVEIKLTASSSIRPKINKEDIENKLKGMKWEEGLSYISTLDFSDQKTEVQFIPSNYPDFLKRFPDRRGGVLVTIKELQVETE